MLAGVNKSRRRTLARARAAHFNFYVITLMRPGARFDLRRVWEELARARSAEQSEVTEKSRVSARYPDWMILPVD